MIAWRIQRMHIGFYILCGAALLLGGADPASPSERLEAPTPRHKSATRTQCAAKASFQKMGTWGQDGVCGGFPEGPCDSVIAN